MKIMERWIKAIAPLFFMFGAGMFFDDFMITNRTHRLLSAILFLLAAIMSTHSPEKKKEEHKFDFEKPPQPLSGTTHASQANDVVDSGMENNES